MLAVSACARAPLEDPSGLAFDAEQAGPDVIVLVDPVAEAPEPEPLRRGPFSFLRRTPDLPAPAPAPEAVLAQTLIAEGAETVSADETEVVASLTDEQIAARGIAADVPPSTQPRLFGFLRNRIPGEAAPGSEPTPTQDMPAEQSEERPEPSLTDEEIAARSAPDEAQRSTKPRLFGFLRGGSDGLVEEQKASFVAPLSLVQPADFGDLLPACGTKKRDMGEEIGRSPGAGSYRLYDSAPGSIEMRPHFVTGFDDGCPRRFDAALALFGSPVVHEAKRYDSTNRAPYTVADDAYERVKARSCGVRRGQYCPPDKLDKLGRDVALLTAYPSFGGSGPWLDVVLFKGGVAGQSIEN